MYEEMWLDFILHDKKDCFGRTIQDIFNFSEEELEDCHNYIQWLFPIHTLSNFNPESPVITKTFVSSLSRDNLNKIKEKLHENFTLMYNFYFNPKQLKPYHWLSKDNHNFLRISRILSCLDLFQAGFDYSDFCYQLSFLKQDFPNIISDETSNIWMRLVPLHVFNSLNMKE